MLSLCHVNIKVNTISCLRESLSEPAFVLNIFHSMFHGGHRVECYMRKPRDNSIRENRQKILSPIVVDLNGLMAQGQASFGKYDLSLWDYR